MSEITRNDLVLVSTETGEILDTFKPGDHLSVTKYEQIDYVKSHVQNFNSEKSFVKIYDDVIPLLERYLTPTEFKFTFSLIPHVSFEDCIIRKTIDRKSKILNLKELAKLHNLKYDYVRKIMSSLKNKGVVGKHETGNILNNYKGKSDIVYTVNPYIFFRGTDVLLPIYSFYSTSGWRELLLKNLCPTQA